MIKTKRKKPLRLKKPVSQVKNWYRNGRWHKVYPKPGRTIFHINDVCQFKPTLLDVRIKQVLPTCNNVFLYQVENVFCRRHTFPAFGNDLLLLTRYKPPLIKKEKPTLVIKKKVKEKPKLVMPHKFEPEPPEEGTIARLHFWIEWRNLWAHLDFNNMADLEKAFWFRLEERPKRKPQQVFIEWYIDPNKTERKQHARKSKTSSNLLPRKKAVLRGGPTNNGRKPVGSNQKKRATKQPARTPNHTNRRRNGKGKEARAVHQ